MFAKAVRRLEKFIKDQGLGWLVGVGGPLVLGWGVYLWEVAVSPQGPRTFRNAVVVFVALVVLWRVLGLHRTDRFQATTKTAWRTLRSRPARRAAVIAMFLVAAASVYIAARSLGAQAEISGKLVVASQEVSDYRRENDASIQEATRQRQRAEALFAENRSLNQPVINVTVPSAPAQSVIVEREPEQAAYIGWGTNESISRNEADHKLLLRLPLKNFHKTATVRAEIAVKLTFREGTVFNFTRTMTFAPEQAFAITTEPQLTAEIDGAVWATPQKLVPVVEIAIKVLGNSAVQPYKLMARLDTRTKKFDLFEP
jgi:hypothetical protein